MPSRRSVLRALGALAVPVSGCNLGASDGPDETDRRRSTARVAGPTPVWGGAGTAAATDRAPTRCEEHWRDLPRWTVERTPDQRYTSFVGDGVVVAADELLRLDPETGAVLWRREVGGFSATLAGDTLVVESSPTLYGFDERSGRLRWRFTFPGRRGSTPDVGGYAVHDGTVYAAVTHTRRPEPYSRLYGIDLRSGLRTRLLEMCYEPPTVGGLTAGDAGLFARWDRDALVGLDRDGTLRWRRSRADEGTDGTAVFPGRLRGVPRLSGGVVLQRTTAGTVALDPASGRLRWRAPAIRVPLATADGTVYWGRGGRYSSPARLAATDAATGETRWRSTAAERGAAVAVAAGSGTVALATQERDRPSVVHLYGAREGCRYARFETETRVRALGITAGTLLLYETGRRLERYRAYEL